ncbi:hypothetical protein [uncultured Campylobacter sp.]|uniref:hypothetical protein n=1 Tax=uncultured Campylobacter sp. TaxID=218934 RepID=UPI00260E0685|nr:hypothetical protein [uncultured Campylobacter sp.]
MKKILAIFSLIFIVAGTFWIGHKFMTTSYDDPPEFADVNTSLNPLKCDLNKGACEVKFNGTSLKIDMTPRPIFAMRPFSFKIINGKNLGLKDPNLVIDGINMNMGSIKARLDQRGDNLIAQVVLSACVVDLMRYRFKLLDGEKDTGFFVDLDLKM